MESTHPALRGKVVLIGGGAKNLGGLMARTFAAEGAKVIIHYNSQSTRAEAEATLASILSRRGEAILLQGDFTRTTDITKVFEEGRRRFGGIDIAVNTVGKVLRKPIAETTEAQYDDMQAVNGKAAFFFLKEAGRTLNDGGRIVTIVTSLLAAFTDGYATYAGSKACVEHFTRAAAKELAGRRISVNALGPGPMDTPFFYGQETPERVAYHKSQALGGQLTRIEDIVPIVRHLVTDGGWITGQTIFANGGYTTR